LVHLPISIILRSILHGYSLLFLVFDLRSLWAEKFFVLGLKDAELGDHQIGTVLVKKKLDKH
jgi:hypothetical protein